MSTRHKPCTNAVVRCIVDLKVWGKLSVHFHTDFMFVLFSFIINIYITTNVYDTYVLLYRVSSVSLTAFIPLQFKKKKYQVCIYNVSSNFSNVIKIIAKIFVKHNKFHFIKSDIPKKKFSCNCLWNWFLFMKYTNHDPVSP